MKYRYMFILFIPECFVKYYQPTEQPRLTDFFLSVYVCANSSNLYYVFASCTFVYKPK